MEKFANFMKVSHGCLYLVAVMDWYTRYVLAWRLSNAMDTQLCLDALVGALGISQQEIFLTDQDSQFTSDDFTDSLQNSGIRISLDSVAEYSILFLLSACGAR